MKKLITALGMAGLCALPLTGQSAAYQEAVVSNGGTITGKASFAGKDQAPIIYNITKDNEVCGTGTREIDYVRVNGDALTDVVVYLEKVKSGKAFPAEISSAVLDQQGCEFKPFVLVMQNKSKVASVNKDPILHNFHTYALMRGDARGPKKTIINVSQPEPSTIHKKVKMPGRAPAMKVECDAHDFMHSFIFVAKNPYFAKVAEDGSYRIDNVPPGNYSIKAWHGMLKNQQAKVEVPAGGTATVDFTFK